MYELKAMHNCAGALSCGQCQEWLPGFLTEHDGELMISIRFLAENIKAINCAIEDCPNEALKLDLFI